MTTTMMIPGRVLSPTREGLYSLMLDAAEAIDQAAAGAVRDPDTEALAEVRECLQDIWRLLDTIGWAGERGDTEIDVREHGQTLAAVLDRIAPMLARWVAELADDHPHRTARQAEYVALREVQATLARLLDAFERDQ